MDVLDESRKASSTLNDNVNIQVCVGDQMINVDKLLVTNKCKNHKKNSQQ